MYLWRVMRKLGRTAKARREVGRGGFKPQFELLDDRLNPSGSPFWFQAAEFAPAPWSTANSADLRANPDSVATQFRVVSMRQAEAGAETRFAVIALDANNRPVPNYTGTVHLTSSDAAATLPADYTFTASDRGVHVFRATLATTGSQTVTATDTADGTITGSTTVTVDAAREVTHFTVLTERNVYAGVAARVTVVALDESNRPVRSYTGTVALTSTDAGATLPADYTFTAADHGVHTFSVTPSATGSLTVTATDTADDTVTGTVTVDVDEAPTATHFVVLARQRVFLGQETQFAVVALDANNRPVPNYTGTITLTSSDTAATLPADYTFTTADRGLHVFTTTLSTAGQITITATDTADDTLTGTVTVRVTDRPAKDARFGGFGRGWR